MKKNKLLALLSAATFIVGSSTFMLSVNADDSDMVVRHIGENGRGDLGTYSYEIVIPNTLNVTGPGYNEVNNGVTIRKLDKADYVTSVLITPRSENNWSLKREHGKETISYSLKTKEEKELITDMYFSDINKITSETGETIECVIDVEEVENPRPGRYTDLITWTCALQYEGIYN